MKRIAITAMVCLAIACHRTPQPAPPETFDQLLMRTEHVTCAELTYHDYGNIPDCQRLYEAWIRGRNRVAAIYPQAKTITMGGVTFYRPRLLWSTDKLYPLIADLVGMPRGITFIQGPPLIEYSYEEVVEHEATHYLTFLLDGQRRRTVEAIATEPDQALYEYTYQVTCHGTSDDPFGEPGNRASCAQPFVGTRP